MKKIIKIFALFLVLSIPIYMASSIVLPSMFPNGGLFEQVTLGMDLKGGHRIVLGVDDNDVRQRIKSNVVDFFKFYHDDASVVSHDGNTIVLNSNKSLPKDTLSAFRTEFSPISILEANGKITISDIDALMGKERASIVKNNIMVIQSRLNSLGTADVSVYKQGDSKIVVELPLSTDMARTKKILTSTSQIGLYLPSTSTDAVELIYEGRPLKRELTPFIKGDSVTEAISTIDQKTGAPVVSVRLTSAGGKVMSEVSSKNVGKPIITTIVEKKMIDGIRADVEKVASYARIATALDRNFVISGMGDLKETEALALVLKSGALSAPMNIVSEQTIDARLGAENIKSGLLAFGVGVSLLFAYIVYLYGMRGAIACFTLVFNASLIVLGLSVFSSAFTLTGIAGIVLTMGIAVDANVIIFEREKELLAGCGNKIKNAFQSSFTPIMDANITTLIAAIILFNVGSIALKGFAVTLGLGVITTLISSYYINKIITLTVCEE